MAASTLPSSASPAGREHSWRVWVCPDRSVRERKHVAIIPGRSGTSLNASMSTHCLWLTLFERDYDVVKNSAAREGVDGCGSFLFAWMVMQSQLRRAWRSPYPRASCCIQRVAAPLYTKSLWLLSRMRAMIEANASQFDSVLGEMGWR